MRKCVINFTDSTGWYPQGQRRLKASLLRVMFDGDVLTWTSHKQLGCPPHQEVPFAFKVYAVRRAQEMGYDLALWADASIYAVKPLTELFNHIETQGYMFQRALPHMTGNWCSDAALGTLGVSREKALEIEELAATCMGFNFKNSDTTTFLDRWFHYANDGITFIGSKTNENQQVSTDPRVQGHRHDQSAASVLAHVMKFMLTPHDKFFSQYPNQSACLVCRREM